MDKKNKNEPLLKDEYVTPPKAAAPRKKSSSEIKEEQDRVREKAELLKLRQGIIDESEMIPEDSPEVIEKPHGWKIVENFFYHYKWFVIGGLFAAVVLGYMIWQLVTKERYDLYVLAVSTQNASGIYAKQVDIEKALERYCPDFDNNGYVHVAINFINLSTENGVNEFTDSEQYKFSAEIMTGDSQIYIADSGIMDLIDNIAGYEIEYFKDFSEEFPDAALYDGCGLQLNTTGFKDKARWQSCPDMLGLYVRTEFENMTGNNKDAIEQRRRAEEVFRNIAENNIVNPD